MIKATTTLAVLLASFALPAAASARTVPMSAGKAAIVRQAYGIGKRNARKAGEPFVKAQASNCYHRNGGVYCSVQLDYTTLYCTGVNGAAVYSGGRLDAKLWVTAGGSEASCKHYPPPAPKPKPKPKPAPKPTSPGTTTGPTANNDTSYAALRHGVLA